MSKNRIAGVLICAGLLLGLSPVFTGTILEAESTVNYPFYYDANIPVGATKSGNVPITGLDESSTYKNYYAVGDTVTLADISETDIAAVSAEDENYVLKGWSKEQKALCTSSQMVTDANIITTYGPIAATETGNKVYAVWAAKWTENTHDLTLTNTAEGAAAEGSIFNYTIGFINPDGAAASGEVEYDIGNINHTDTLNSDGTLTINGLKNNESICFRNISEGEEWFIDETDYTYEESTSSLEKEWSTTWKSSAEDQTPLHKGTSSSGKLLADTVVTYENDNPATCDLTVSKAASGPAQISSFSFRIKLKSDSGNALTGDYSCIDEKGNVSTLSFNTEGIATVTEISDGDSFTIKEIPSGTLYSITEETLGLDWLTSNKRTRSIIIRTNSFTASAKDGCYTCPISITAFLPIRSTGTISALPTIPSGSTIQLFKTAELQAGPNPAVDTDVTSDMNEIYTAVLDDSGSISLAAGTLFNSGPYSSSLGHYYISVNYNYPIVGDDAGENGTIAEGTLGTDETVEFTNTFMSAAITPNTATFNKGSADSITVDKYDGNFKLNSIVNGTKALTENTDYMINGDSVTISNSYLNSLPAGVSKLTFDFGVTNNPVLTITVKQAAKTITGGYIVPNTADRG